MNTQANLYDALTPTARSAICTLLGFANTDTTSPDCAGFRNTLRDIPLSAIKGTLTVGKAFRAYLKQVGRR